MSSPKGGRVRTETSDPVPCRQTLCALFDSLCSQSVRNYRRSHDFPGWPDDLDRNQWFTSPELVSLDGTAVWSALGEPQRRLVSFWEAVNFYSANIHGEAALMQGIAARLYAPGHRAATPYLHHMLDEENKHSVWFAEFCRRYAGRIYPDRTVSLGNDPAEAGELLFFVRVMLFEDVVDGFNAAMARDGRLAPVARWINANHHDDERRHLAFGRLRVRELFADGRGGWSDAVLAEVRASIVAYLRALWVPLYNPAVYADAGLPDPYGLAEQAYRSPQSRARRANLSRRSVGFLLRHHILDERPQP